MERQTLIGTGALADPDEVRAVAVTRDPVATPPSGPLQRGWVGWLGYESGAAAAGASTTGQADGDVIDAEVVDEEKK